MEVLNVMMGISIMEMGAQMNVKLKQAGLVSLVQRLRQIHATMRRHILKRFMLLILKISKFNFLEM